MRRVEVAVVGGGPAGLSAAAAAAQAGAQVVLYEENRSLGGQLRYRVGGPSAAKLIDEAAASSVELRPGSVVWGHFAGGILGVSDAGDGGQIRAERIVLATGSTDLPFPFPGGSLPGVLTARACQILLHIHRVLPGRTVAIIGTGTDADEVARDVTTAGGRVVVQVDPDRDGRQLEAFGNDGVQCVTVSGRQYDVDVIVVAVGRQPDMELALMAECAVGYASELGGFVPLRDGDLRCSVPGIVVAGDAGGVCDVATAIAEGRFAGLSAAAAIGYVDEDRLASARVAYAGAVGNRLANVAALTAALVRV